jgi:hypothetical protein
MTQDPAAASAARVPIRFDASVSSVPQDVTCGNCRTPLRATYHMLGESMVCGACRGQLEGTVDGSARMNRFGRALLFGTGAAVAGALVYYAIMAATGYSIGLLAILVGYMVGRAVNVGCRGKGGRKYQLLAAFLTYFAMSSTYVAEGLRGLKDEKGNGVSTTVAPTSGDSASTAHSAVESTPDVVGITTAGAAGSKAESGAQTSHSLLVAFITMFVIVLIAPILAGFSSPLLLLILGFGVYQAWKMNRAVTMHFTGPFDLRSASPPAVA